VDIDCQYGNAKITDPSFSYSSYTASPTSLIGLKPQRGVEIQGNGRGVNVVGGTATILSSSGRLAQIFSIASFSADDVSENHSVRSFKFNGRAEAVCLISPTASSEFNKVTVYKPVFRDCEFQDISSAFFKINRSGTGYSFVEDASVVNCSVLPTKIEIAELETTNVGISYELVERNDNIGFFYLQNYFQGYQGIASEDSFTRTLETPFLSTVEITVSYASGAGDNYHAHRKSLIHMGYQASDSFETVISSRDSNFGNWAFSFNITTSGGKKFIEIIKPTGSSNTTGTITITAISVQGVKDS
jgi:hypothetical protein